MQRTRVVSVPAAHPYVQRVTDHSRIILLPDPLPAGAAPGVWWPPVALDPEWIAAHAGAADLLHIHFGTESFPPERLLAVVDAAHANGWPVVLTVHDIEHPQLVDQAPYRAQLDALVPVVDAVLTLTSSAAERIRGRWGVEARVLGHPRLLGAEAGAAPRAAEAPPAVGLHLKDLRPNVDAAGATRSLLAAARLLAAAGTPVDAEIRMHDRVRDEAVRDEVRALVAAADRDSRVRLTEHARLDDDALAASLAALDACVLPYRWGTHSGWLELCWDLGVPVVAPALGHYADQHDDPTVTAVEPEAEVGRALAAALARVLAAGTRAGTPERAALSSARLAERAVTDSATAEAHARLYRALIDARGPAPAGEAAPAGTDAPAPALVGGAR